MPRSAKSFVLLLAALSLTLGTALTAGATSAVGTQNPRLTVRVALTSERPNPNRATVGDTVTASGSVENTTAQARNVAVTVTVIPPSGWALSATEQVVLGPHEVLERSFSYVIDEHFQTGTYRLRIVARNAGAASRATARIVVF